MRDPSGLDPSLVAELADVDMQAVHPLNLFRICWRNDPITGGFGDVNYLELPSELTGAPARIVGLIGEHFRPTAPSGHLRATIAGAAHSTAPCLGAGPWRSCRRR
jgi:hypothetical protein